MIEEGDRAAVRQTGSLEEVAGARTHVEVPPPEVPPIPHREPSRRAAPHHGREEAEDQRVVDPEEEQRVLPLALVGGVDPDRQGAGYGTAMLRPMLERADREGFPAYLGRCPVDYPRVLRPPGIEPPAAT